MVGSLSSAIVSEMLFDHARPESNSPNRMSRSVIRKATGKPGNISRYVSKTRK